MNRLMTSITLALLSFCATWSEACAQQRSIDPGALPRGDRIHPSPMKIQIVNDAPQITSVPPAPEGKKILLIKMPQPQTAPTEFIYANPGADAGIQGLPPGMAAVDLSKPPVARFGSNLPAGGFSQRDRLPAGQSSSGLLGQNVSGKMNPPGAQKLVIPGAAPQTQFNSSQQQPLEYTRPTGSGTEGSNGSRTTTTVNAKRIIDRGSLLDKTHTK